MSACVCTHVRRRPHRLDDDEAASARRLRLCLMLQKSTGTAMSISEICVHV
jgi:hypothetical protein